jgi:hypothetical protein
VAQQCLFAQPLVWEQKLLPRQGSQDLRRMWIPVILPNTHTHTHTHKDILIDSPTHTDTLCTCRVTDVYVSSCICVHRVRQHVHTDRNTETHTGHDARVHTHVHAHTLTYPPCTYKQHVVHSPLQAHTHIPEQLCASHTHMHRCKYPCVWVRVHDCTIWSALILAPWASSCPGCVHP